MVGMKCPRVLRHTEEGLRIRRHRIHRDISAIRLSEVDRWRAVPAVVSRVGGCQDGNKRTK